MADLSKLTEFADEMRGDMQMIRERFPDLAPRIDARMAELAQGVMDAFQPIFDLADGKITHEEFCTIVERRQAAELEQRRQHWAGAFNPETKTWTVQCEDCCKWVIYVEEGENLAYDQIEGPPPMYPQCEDCENAEDEEDEEEDGDDA